MTPKIANTANVRMSNGFVGRREAFFEQAAEAAYRAVLAITQQQEAHARSAVDELRFLRSLITTGEPHQSMPDKLVNPTATSLQRMRLALEAVRESDEVIQAWQRQNLALVARNGSSLDALAWQRLMDHALPAAWNFEADLLVVHGAPDPGLLGALRERGQRRVVVIAPTPETSLQVQGLECFVGDDAAALSAFTAGLSKPYPKTCAEIYGQLGSAMVTHEEEAERAAQAILVERIKHSVTSNWMYHNTRRLFAQRWVQQGVANIPAVARHANLRVQNDRFHDKPAILIAPGPSLDKNIDLLRQAKGKAVLIAPLQSLRRLYRAGIQPDFVTVLDAADLTSAPLDFFGDVPDEFLTTLIVAVNCHPHVIQRFQRVVFFSGNGPLDSWVESIVPEPLHRLRAPSVALTNLLLARYWGCNPIVLVGQDLAFSGQKQYAGEERNSVQRVRRTMTLPGYFGGTVQSPSDYYLFHHQFELIAANIGSKNPDVSLYNCTEGGAFIKGFQHELLQKVLDHCVVNLPERPIAQIATSEKIFASGRLEAAQLSLQRTFSMLDDLLRQAKQLDRLSQQPRPNAALLRKLADKERSLRFLLSNIKGFTSVYQDDIDEAMVISTKSKTLRENLVASRMLYQVVKEGCLYFRPLVEQALENLATVADLKISADVGETQMASLV
jgi:hypothetical protein